MAISQGNNSAMQVESIRKLYSGLTNVRVLAFNPNKEQLEKLGFRPQKELEYTKVNDSGVVSTRVDIYIGNAHLRSKITIFLEDREMTSNDGTKTCFINKKNNTAWRESIEDISGNPNMAWFDTTGLRPAYPGEETLNNFIIAWMNLNVRAEDFEVRLEKIDKLIKEGDVSELIELFKGKNADRTNIKDNELKVLAVGRKSKDGKIYQDVFTGYFGKATFIAEKQWKDAIAKEYGGLQEYHILQDGFKFAEIEPDLSVNRDSGSTTQTPSQGSFGDVDDDPF